MVGSVWKQMVILVPDRVLVRFIRWSFFRFGQYALSTYFSRVYSPLLPSRGVFLLYFTIFVLYLKSYFTCFLLA